MVIRNLILDWSGTLVDDLEPVFRTTNHVLAAFQLPPLTQEEFRREFCLPLTTFYRRRLPGVPQEELERRFLAHYAAYQSAIRLLPHTVGFLQFCARAQRRLFVASTADPATYQNQMKRFGIGHYIDRAYLGIADKRQTIHRILAENKLEPGETMFVGDMEHDIEAGKAGGVFTCAVLTGYNHADMLRALAPDLVCEHLGELQSYLEQQMPPALPTGAPALAPGSHG